MSYLVIIRVYAHMQKQKPRDPRGSSNHDSSSLVQVGLTFEEGKLADFCLHFAKTLL